MGLMLGDRISELLMLNIKPIMGPVSGQAAVVHSPFKAKHQLSSNGVEKHEALISSAKIDATKEFITVTFGGEEGSKYPASFLRHSCYCSKCFNPNPRSNNISLFTFNPDVKATYIEVSEAETSLTVQWDDEHQSNYSAEWLYVRRFTPEGRKEREEWHQKEPILWNATSLMTIPTDKFENIMNDDLALYNWISTLEKVGLFVITDAPENVGQIERLSDRVAYLRLNHYGKYFQIKSKPNPSTFAYTNVAIELHTDLPYYRNVPGMQMLHCIQQADGGGGANGFADGFFAAKQLKEKHPEYYKLLTTVKIEFWDIGEDDHKFYLMDKKPVIRLNNDGEVIQISFGPRTMDSFMSVPPEHVKIVYKALKKFNDLINEAENLVKVKLKNGEIACFHNFRILHSRYEFTTTGNSPRLLEGGYIDWDELRSRRRVLQLEYGLKE